MECKACEKVFRSHFSDLTSQMEKEMRLGEGGNERVIISQGDGCVSDASLLETGNWKN